MIYVNKKLLNYLPCVIILLLFGMFQVSRINADYNKLLSSSGLITEDYRKKIDLENNRARQNEKEYQEILIKEGEEDQIKSNPSSEQNNKKSSGYQKLKLHSRGAVLLDASNNRVLYEENGYKELPMASTTKIMTCIVALENSKPNEVVTISKHASSMPDVQLNAKPGEKFYLGDLLYSLMLESHNDIAVAIAEHVGGSVEGFATMMNDKARKLGCEHTNFVTPNGLDAPGHHTSARDLAVIASYAIKNKEFIKITNAPTHEFYEIKNKKKYFVSNKDRFLYMMEGAIGVKTGFTNGAGYCFVGAVQKPDRTLVSAVLGCGWPPSKNLKWNDTKELMNYGVKNYSLKQIFQDKKLQPLIVKDGQQRYEPLTMKGDISLLLRDDEQVRVEYDLPKGLVAPIKSSVEIGKAKYYVNDVLYKEIPIYATKDIKKIDLIYCLKKIVSYWSGRF